MDELVTRANLDVSPAFTPSPLGESWSAEGITAKLPRADHSLRYFSREYMEKEWANMWPNVWLLAGIASDVKEAGDFFKYDMGRESFIIVRSDADTVRAFYNVCPHRGNQLVSDDFGVLDKFVCPFHNWKFGLDGKNKEVTDRETFKPETLCNDLSLSPVLCEVFAGLVFVSMNPRMMPLREWLGPIAEKIELFELDKMIPVRHGISGWHANWKMGIDGFSEAYHVQGLHPQMDESNDGLASEQEVYPNGMSGAVTRWAQPAVFYPDKVTINESLKIMLRSAGIDPATYKGSAMDVRRDIQLAKREMSVERVGIDYSRFPDELLTDNLSYVVFPNIIFGLHPEASTIFQFIPHPTDPERSTMNAITLFRPIPGSDYAPEWIGLDPSTDVSGETRPDILRVDPAVGESPGLGLTLDQDALQFPFVQRGQRSRGYRGPLLSEQERRIGHFHAELDLYVNGKKA